MTRQSDADYQDEQRRRRKVADAQGRAARSRTLKDRCRRHLRLEKYFPELAEAVGTWPEFQGAELLNLKCPPHPHNEQQLPEGRTCGTCDNFRHCHRLDYATPDQVHCDFLPSRYREGEQP